MHEYDYDINIESAFQKGKRMGYDAAIKDVLNLLKNYTFVNGYPTKEEVDNLLKSINSDDYV